MSKCVSDKGAGIREARRWQRFWGLRFGGGSVESAAAVQGTNCEDTHALAPCNLEPEARGGEGRSARISQNKAPAFNPSIFSDCSKPRSPLSSSRRTARDQFLSADERID